MTKKIQLPVPLNETYFEPVDWRMPLGTICVRELTVQERTDSRFSGCHFVARTNDGDWFAFEFVSDALIHLTIQGYDIFWQLVRGEQIEG